MARFPLILGLAALAANASCKTRPEDGASVKDLPSRSHDLGTYSCPDGVTRGIKVAFFDADSTLRVSKSGSVSANGIDDVNLLPFVGKKLAELNRDGFLVAVVSNQGGVAQGHITFEVAEGALVTTARLASEMGARIDYLAMAPNDDEDRKPKTGMAKRLEQLLREKCGTGIDYANSFMVGDSGYKKNKDGPHPDGRPADDFSNADRFFAKNVFAPDGELTSKHFQEPTDYFGWREFGVYNIENQGELEDFLVTIEARAKALRAENGDAARIAALEQEVRSLRRTDRLPPLFRYVHYNIKELTTAKLLDAQNEQINTAAKIIRNLGPDLLSINEMQYDLPDVPTPGLPGTGQNMKRLIERTRLEGRDTWSFNLAQANTGNRAKKKQDGSYATDPNGPGSADLADVISFGTFPGQYSTGFGTRLSIEARAVYTDLKWKDWDASLQLGSLTLPNGQPAPETMELFDKNFNDTTVLLEGRTAHFITFHTVPAFGFGGSADLNIARNKSQLEFLAWYLTGQCEPSNEQSAVKSCQTDIRPLAENTPFIAVGDLNVDWSTSDGGAAVLKSLLTNARVHNWRAPNPDHLFRAEEDTKKSYITYMSDGVDLGKLQSELDYFVVSKHFRIANGKVSAPLSWFKDHGCHPTRTEAETKRAAAAAATPSKSVTISTRYGDNNTRSYCVVEVSKEFADYRKGSDHFPAYVTFGWAAE